MAGRAAARAAGGELNALVLGLTVPAEAPNIAIRDAYSAKPLARAAPFTHQDIVWGVPHAPDNAAYVPQNQNFAVITRDPLHYLATYDVNQNAQVWDYTWVFGRTPAGDTLVEQLEGVGVLTNLDPTWAIPTVGVPYQPYDDRLYAWNDDKERCYMHLDNGAYLTAGASRVSSYVFTINSVNPGNTYDLKISIYKINAGVEVLATEQTPTGVAVGAPVTVNMNSNANDSSPGRFRITMLISAITGVQDAPTVTVRQTGNSPVLKWQALPQLTPNGDSISGLKFIANAMKWENNSKVLDKNGKFVSVQFSKGDDIYSQIFNTNGKDLFTNIGAIQGVRAMNYERGGYIYLKPEEEQDFQLQTPFILGSWGVSDAGSPLNLAGWMIFVARAGTPADETGQVATIDVNTKVAYSTKNIWLDVRVPEETPAQWTQAVETVTSMEQVFPDPSIQWKTVFSTIGKLARLSAPVLAAFGPYGRAASVVAGGVGNILGNLGYRTKKTARSEEEQARVDGEAQDREAQPKRSRRAPGVREADGQNGEEVIMAAVDQTG